MLVVTAARPLLNEALRHDPRIIDETVAVVTLNQSARPSPFNPDPDQATEPRNNHSFPDPSDPIRFPFHYDRDSWRDVLEGG